MNLNLKKDTPNECLHLTLPAVRPSLWATQVKPVLNAQNSNLNMKELHELLTEVENEKSFLIFVKALIMDRDQHESKQTDDFGFSDDWANNTISDYLDSAVAWAEASKFGLSQDSELAHNKWRQFATFLYCGKIYE